MLQFNGLLICFWYIIMNLYCFGSKQLCFTYADFSPPVIRTLIANVVGGRGVGGGGWRREEVNTMPVFSEKLSEVCYYFFSSTISLNVRYANPSMLLSI